MRRPAFLPAVLVLLSNGTKTSLFSVGVQPSGWAVLRLILAPLAFLSVLLVLAPDLSAQDEKDPMTLELTEIALRPSPDGKGGEDLVLSIRMQNNTDVFYFVPESGFNLKIDVSGAEHVFKYVLPGIRLQGLAVPPHASLALGNINCGKAAFALESGTIGVTYEISPDTDLSSIEQGREIYGAEIVSPKYAFRAVESPSQPGIPSARNILLKPLGVNQ